MRIKKSAMKEKQSDRVFVVEKSNVKHGRKCVGVSVQVVGVKN